MWHLFHVVLMHKKYACYPSYIPFSTGDVTIERNLSLDGSNYSCRQLTKHATVYMLASNLLIRVIRVLPRQTGYM